MGIQIRYEHGPDEHEIEVYEVKAFKEVLDEIDPRYHERLKQLSGRAVGDVLATAYFSDRSKLEDSRQHDIFAAYLEKLRGTDSQLLPYMFGVTNREITPVQRQVARGLACAVHPLLARGSNGVAMAETKVDETGYDSRSKVPESTEQNHIDATDAEEKNQADSNVTPEQGVLPGAAYSEKPPIQNVNVHSETGLEKPAQVDLLAIAKGEVEAEEGEWSCAAEEFFVSLATQPDFTPAQARILRERALGFNTSKQLDDVTKSALKNLRTRASELPSRLGEDPRVRETFNLFTVTLLGARTIEDITNHIHRTENEHGKIKDSEDLAKRRLVGAIAAVFGGDDE